MSRYQKSQEGIMAFTVGSNKLASGELRVNEHCQPFKPRGDITKGTLRNRSNFQRIFSLTRLYLFFRRLFYQSRQQT